MRNKYPFKEAKQNKSEVLPIGLQNLRKCQKFAIFGSCITAYLDLRLSWNSKSVMGPGVLGQRFSAALPYAVNICTRIKNDPMGLTSRPNHKNQDPLFASQRSNIDQT